MECAKRWAPQIPWVITVLLIACVNSIWKKVYYYYYYILFVIIVLFRVYWYKKIAMWSKSLRAFEIMKSTTIKYIRINDTNDKRRRKEENNRNKRMTIER